MKEMKGERVKWIDLMRKFRQSAVKENLIELAREIHITMKERVDDEVRWETDSEELENILYKLLDLEESIEQEKAAMARSEG